MSKIICSAAIRGAHKIVERAEREWKEAMDQWGAKEPVGFTSSWESWQYIKNRQSLPRTRKALDFMCDFRIPLTFSLEDCKTVAAVIKQVAAEIFN